MSFTLLLSVDAKGEPEAQICQDRIIILNEMRLYWDLRTALLYKQDRAELHKCSQSAQPLDRNGLWHTWRGLNHPNTAVMGQKTETTQPRHSQTISAFAMKTDWTHGFASHCFVWNWQCPPQNRPSEALGE